MKKLSALFVLILLSLPAYATDYVFSYWGSNYPPCSGGSWSESGSVFTCSGRVVLSSGDTVQVSTGFWEYGDITIVADNGFSLSNNTIGTTSKTITLQSNYGSIDSTGSNSVTGDIVSSSGNINLTNTTVTGNISTAGTVTMSGGSVSGNISASNGVTLTNTIVSGTITATNGSINLSGGQVSGLVESNCCMVTTDGTDLYGGARSDSSGISISNGTIQGDFYAANNYAEFNNVNMLSGSITGASSLVINNSTLGTASDPVVVSTQSGPITLNDTTAYGDFTTPSWTTVIANGSTVIIGTCTPGSTPASACQVSSALTCLNDDFGRSDLGSEWVSSSFSGSFTPQIVSNRLMLTEDQTYQSTATTLQRWFPAENNLVVIEFDHYAWSRNTGDGADGITLVFSDATVTPQAGSFGGSLGYAQRDNGDSGFAGGWIGIALDEYGNFSNPTEGRIGGTGFVPNSVSIRGSGVNQTGYRYITGTNSLTPNIDVRNTRNPRPGYRYRITIDARTGTAAYVSVERSTNNSNSFTTLVAPVNVTSASGQASIPQNLWLSLTGSTGGSSNYHAIDNLQVCARTINPVGPLVHHFEMSYGSAALTCSPTDVTIRACANASCSQLLTDDVSVTLSPSGWVGGNTQTITGGVSTFQLWHTTAETVALEVVTSLPARQAYTQNTCSIDGGALTANCSLTVADAGFIVDVADFIAGKGTTTAQLTAVKSSDNSQSCVPAFANVTRSVNFKSTYIDPDNSARVVSWPLSVDGTALPTDGSTQAVDITFDATGSASLAVNYSDAGMMQLDAVYNGSGDDAGLVLAGNTQFVSAPAGFCVKTGGECTASDKASCTAFTSAGTPFNLTVQAVGWQVDGDTDLCNGNTPTPSFTANALQLSAEKVSPAGGVNGVVTPAQFDQQMAVNNLNTVAVKESEVGVFNFRVHPSQSYLGVTLPDGLSQPTGRFYPHHFAAAVVNSGELSAFCSASTPFTYSGQDLPWLVAPRLSLTALNADGAVTKNYTEAGYQRLSSGGVSVDVPNTDNVAQGIDNTALPVTASAADGSLSVGGAGVLLYDFNATGTVNYDKSVNARIVPFTPSLTYSLTQVTDSDNVGLNVTLLNILPAAPFELRYGRLWLESGYGPETMDLALNLRAEYFNNEATGNRFVLNSDDSCWQYDSPANITLGTSGLTEVAGQSGTLVTGEGTAAIQLRAPVNVAGTPDTGETTLRYASPLWLQDDFDGDGTLEDHSAIATFGVYRGHDRIIYWREVYQ